jgi:putative transposase
VSTFVGHLYSAVVLDAWSRRIVGWSMQDHLRTELVLDALDMAITRRQPDEIIHHSDQGCQYTSLAFSAHCAELGVQPSMGSVGDVYDNAMCESFFATPRVRAARSRAPPQSRRGRCGHLRFHRGVLQPKTSALSTRLPLTCAI